MSRFSDDISMDDGVRFDVSLVHETKNALLVEYELEEVWIPKSQIKDEEYDGEGGGEFLIAIWIPEWLANEKGML